MKHKRHYEHINQTAVREEATIVAIVATMHRTVQLLDCDVRSEEERSRVCDLSDVNYPILARTLAARRDNMKATISVLEARLSTVRKAAEPKVSGIAA